MTTPTFTNSKDAKAAGWFSRRHETREAHDAAREKFFTKRNKNNAPKQRGVTKKEWNAFMRELEFPDLIES